MRFHICDLFNSLFEIMIVRNSASGTHLNFLHADSRPLDGFCDVCFSGKQLSICGQS